MDAPEAATEEASPLPPRPDAFAAVSGALEQAVRVAEAALALLRAELRLARGSALALVWLAFALIFLGVGAWLATSAAIAAGVYELTGNLFVGIGSVALANLIGIGLVLFAMRSCWRDLTLPRTRRMLGQLTDSRHEPS
ncbi:hypothetical protein [Dokdonella sp.]|uniref:hypothetical protein n=1 Tax=Dokdonella sp. TaxID=2291710 RepID=UPI001AFE2478|nr:hypothetical protein [Dokdonella sp.]MBO9664882.1 hypothetical protein [Dokdonella sp.]